MEAVRGTHPRVETLSSRMVSLERRVEAVESAADTRAELLRKVNDIVAHVGHPSDGPSSPATGLYHLIESQEARVRAFERLREQMLGAMVVGGPVLAVLWIVAGDKIVKLFHG